LFRLQFSPIFCIFQSFFILSVVILTLVFNSSPFANHSIGTATVAFLVRMNLCARLTLH
jgi:hypothetical protein